MALTTLSHPLDTYFVKTDGSAFYTNTRAAVGKDDAQFAAWKDTGGQPQPWPKDGDGAQTLASLQPMLPEGIWADLTAYAAAKRYDVETGGIEVDGAHVDTSRDSQGMIANAYALMQATEATSIPYKAASGFVTLTADQFKGLAIAVGAHVQGCFAKEAQAVVAIAAGTITSVAQVDAAFA